MIAGQVYKKATFAFFLFLSFSTPHAIEAAQRELHVSHVERDGDNHVKLRVQAYELEQGKKYPLTMLNQDSFEVIVNGERKNKTHFSLQSFSSNRRENGRAAVWIYDATGVKTIRALTRSLRTLTSQDFPNFTADYTSVFGVARGKTIERGTIDGQRTDTVLSLQKKLSGNPKGLKQSDVTTEPSLCAALNKFRAWNRYGLKSTDQKVVFMLGGSDLHSNEYLARQNDCVQKLSQMSVSIHQIVFASEERIQKRIWVDQEQIIKNGSMFRVIDLAGASRALATLQALLDNEYEINAQLPSESARLAQQIIIKGRYHGDTFSSPSLILPEAPSKTNVIPTRFVRLGRADAPQKLVAVQNAAQLALEGWIEWLFTSFLIGLAVTLRHINRIKSESYLYSNDGHSTLSEDLPSLVVLSGKHRGKLIPLDKMSCVLGSSWNCDVRLNARGVFWRHGRIEISGDKAIVEDLSRGQLLVNGRVIKKVRAIGHGSVIQLGELQLLFQCGDT